MTLLSIKLNCWLTRKLEAGHYPYLYLDSNQPFCAVQINLKL